MADEFDYHLDLGGEIGRVGVRKDLARPTKGDYYGKSRYKSYRKRNSRKRSVMKDEYYDVLTRDFEAVIRRGGSGLVKERSDAVDTNEGGGEDDDEAEDFEEDDAAKKVSAVMDQASGSNPLGTPNPQRPLAKEGGEEEGPLDKKTVNDFANGLSSAVLNEKILLHTDSGIKSELVKALKRVVKVNPTEDELVSAIRPSTQQLSKAELNETTTYADIHFPIEKRQPDRGKNRSSRRV